VSNRADEYRRRAQQCLEMAAAFKSPQARGSLSHMAQVWLRLADNYGDAKVMVGRPKAAEEARPVVQQQQQIQPKDEDKNSRP
jgi:L-lactate utilization protein LutC